MTPAELIQGLWGSSGGREVREATRAIAEISAVYSLDAPAVLRSLLRHLAHAHQLGLLKGAGSLDQDLMVGLTAVDLVRGRITATIDSCDAALAQNHAILEMAHASLRQPAGGKEDPQE